MTSRDPHPTASGGQRRLPDEPTLAARIDWLLRYRWPQHAPEPRTNAEAAAVITAVTGTKVSSTTIWKLRTGRESNPAYSTLTMLARFFSVDLVSRRSF